MLENPHIWACHRRHDEHEIHPRSLTSSKTMLDYDHNPGADPHTNGTIWAAALWDLRTQMRAEHHTGARKTDLLVLKSLLLVGQITGNEPEVNIASIRRARASYLTNMAALLSADELLNGGRHHLMIQETFSRHGIKFDGDGGSGIQGNGIQNEALTATNVELWNSGQVERGISWNISR